MRGRGQYQDQDQDRGGDPDPTHVQGSEIEVDMIEGGSVVQDLDQEEELVIEGAEEKGQETEVDIAVVIEGKEIDTIEADRDPDPDSDPDPDQDQD